MVLNHKTLVSVLLKTIKREGNLELAILTVQLLSVLTVFKFGDESQLKAKVFMLLPLSTILD